MKKKIHNLDGRSSEDFLYYLNEMVSFIIDSSVSKAVNYDRKTLYEVDLISSIDNVKDMLTQVFIDKIIFENNEYLKELVERSIRFRGNVNIPFDEIILDINKLIKSLKDCKFEKLEDVITVLGSELENFENLLYSLEKGESPSYIFSSKIKKEEISVYKKDVKDAIIIHINRALAEEGIPLGWFNFREILPYARLGGDILIVYDASKNDPTYFLKHYVTVIDGKIDKYILTVVSSSFLRDKFRNLEQISLK